MTSVQTKLFRTAWSFAVCVSIGSIVLFYASGKDKEVESRISAEAHDKAIYARAAEQGTTYNEIRLRSFQACQMTVPDPPDTGFMYRGNATDAARRECVGSVLYGDQLDSILQHERFIYSILVLLSLAMVFLGAGASVYVGFGLYRLVSGVWWPWVAGK